jgi:hypothetical protein
VTRLHTLRTGSAGGGALSAKIRAAAGSNARHCVNVIRIAPDGVTAYDWHPDRLPLADDAAEAVSDLMHSVRPDIDWSVPHDYHLTTGMLRRSPLPGERGYAPETDRVFGGADPVFLPRPAETREGLAA